MNIGGVKAALGAIAFLVVAGSFCACGDEDLTFVAGKRPGGIRAPNGAGGGATDDTGGAGGGGGILGAATRDASSPDDDAGSGTGGVGGASQGTGGGAEPRDAERDVAIADVTDARGLVDRIEGGVRDAAEAGVAANDAGPANVVFSFDTDGDFTPWSTLNDVNGISTGGPLSPSTDEAVPGHAPGRALVWTATFTAYETSARALAQFARPPSWSGRSALHFTVKITSNPASLGGYQIYFQTGGPSFASRYLDEQPVAQIADSAFHDVSVSLANTTISGSVTFIGFVLSAGTRPAGAAAVPPPAVIEIDNIWLE